MGDDDNRIGYLIDYIEYKMPYSSDGGTLFYEELLQCSLRSENLYGQAVAYMNFSRVYQDLQQNEQYTECIKKAYEIAESEKYHNILIRCYNLEGIRYMQNYDEANALSMYLKGISLAIEISDYNLCGILYNNIAEIFYGNYDYDKAILYYLKALNALELVTDRDQSRYRKAFLENIISSYCYKNDLYHAKKYLYECKNIVCDDNIRPFALEEAQLKVLMLEKKREEALQYSLDLFQKVKTSEFDDTLMFYVYSYLCDFFMEFKKKEEALFCLSKLEQMKMELSQNYSMETQKRKIRCYEIFDIRNDSMYKEFYEITVQCERNNTKAISNSLSAAVLLYETEKEKRQIKKQRKVLEEVIKCDPLTGVYNRRMYDQIVKDCMLDKGVKEIAYIMIDIDYFKNYNDYYGHHKGDLVLKSVSALIQENLPRQAYLARYGGDEFACLLINKSMQEVESFMKSIFEKIEEIKIEHVDAKNGTHLTLSLGACYACKNDITDIDTMIKKADDALYQVKNNGRNGYQILY